MPKASDLKRGDVVQIEDAPHVVKQLEAKSPSARGAGQISDGETGSRPRPSIGVSRPTLSLKALAFAHGSAQHHHSGPGS